MEIVGMIVMGLIVGLLARFLLPGKDTMGILMTIVLGIAGSLLAGYGGQMLGLYPPGAQAGWIASIVGAIVLLLLYRVFVRKQS